MRDKELEQKIFSVQSADEFERLALEVFHFQYANCPVYKDYVDLLNRPVKNFAEIPFLPIEFFKSQKVKTANDDAKLIFESSGTTGNQVSRHHVLHPELYTKSFIRCFELFYGPVSNYRILALLPSYLERKGSSLVFMVNELIERSNHSDSGFYLDNFEALNTMLLKNTTVKTLLIGVSFGLLDFIEKFYPRMENTIIMETGGMKGRRKEMIRTELHDKLKKGFGVTAIHSEYGMTELLSQAYAQYGYFKTPPWMKILIRDVNDPFTQISSGKTGGIDVIDLANLYSCSFISTSDLGKEVAGEGIEIMGRFDYSDIRGCNLMVAN